MVRERAMNAIHGTDVLLSNAHAVEGGGPGAPTPAMRGEILGLPSACRYTKKKTKATVIYPSGRQSPPLSWHIEDLACQFSDRKANGSYFEPQCAHGIISAISDPSPLFLGFRSISFGFCGALGPDKNDSMCSPTSTNPLCSPSHPAQKVTRSLYGRPSNRDDPLPQANKDTGRPRRLTSSRVRVAASGSLLQLPANRETGRLGYDGHPSLMC